MAKKHFGFAFAAAIAALTAPPQAAYAAYIDITAGQASTSLVGGAFQYGFTTNGTNTNLDRGGAPYSAPIGTTLTFAGKLSDRGTTAASSTQVFVLPYAGAKYAVADLSVSNTASSSLLPLLSTYLLTGVYRSGENVLVPDGARTIVAGDTFDFDTPYAANTLYTTAVPEPASMLLMASGVGAAIIARRRRARRLEAAAG